MEESSLSTTIEIPESFQRLNTTSNATAPSSKGISIPGVVLSVTISLVAIPANVIVIICLMRESSDRKTSGFTTYTTFVAFVDLLIGAVVTPLHIFLSYLARFSLGRTMCILWKLLDFGLTSVSMYLFLAMGYDRYRCVTAPLQYRSQFRRHRATKISLALLSLGFGVWLPYILLKMHVHGTRETCPSLTNNTNYLDTIQLILVYGVPLLLLIVMNSVLVSTLKRKSKMTRTLQRKIPLRAYRNGNVPTISIAVLSSSCYVGTLANPGATKSLSSFDLSSISDDNERPRENINTPNGPTPWVNFARKTQPTENYGSTCTPCEKYSRSLTGGVSNRTFHELPATSRLRASRNSSAKKVLIMALTFLLLWLPFCVSWFLEIFCANCVSSGVVVAVTGLSYGQSAANPIVLILSSTKIRSKISAWFGCRPVLNRRQVISQGSQ